LLRKAGFLFLFSLTSVRNTRDATSTAPLQKKNKKKKKKKKEKERKRRKRKKKKKKKKEKENATSMACDGSRIPRSIGGWRGAGYRGERMGR
jgi:mannitol-specific phosphotransferase system IIBC component